MRDPAVARWQAHLHGLATPIRELSGLTEKSWQQTAGGEQIAECGFGIADLRCGMLDMEFGLRIFVFLAES